MHLVGCLYYLYQWWTVKQISDNEIYFLIKYIKSFLWRVAKCLSYIEEARCLKVNGLPWFLKRVGYFATSFFCVPVFCPKLELYVVLLQSLCLFYNLSKCMLLFFLHISSLLLLFSFNLLLYWSSFFYLITQLERSGNSTVLFLFSLKFSLV